LKTEKTFKRAQCVNAENSKNASNAAKGI